MQTLQTNNVSVFLAKCYQFVVPIMLAESTFAAEQAKEEAVPTEDRTMMKNIVLAGMVVAGIAVIFTANKKPAVIVAQPSIGDLRNVKPQGKSTVAFEDDYEGSFKPATKGVTRGKKSHVIEVSSDEGEVVEDDGDDAWDDKDGSAEEVEDFSGSEQEEFVPQQHGHSHGGQACHGHGAAAQKPKAKKKTAVVESDDNDSGWGSSEGEDDSGEEGQQGDTDSEASESASEEEEEDDNRDAARKEFIKNLHDAKLKKSAQPSMQDYLKLKAIISRHGLGLFQVLKDELLVKRLEHMKKEEWAEYGQCIMKAQQGYTKIFAKETGFGLKQLGIPQEMFYGLASQFEETNGEAYETACEEQETAIRVSLDPMQVDLSRDQIKVIHKEIMQGEHKVQVTKPTEGVNPQMFYMLEKTKLYDNIYMNHGIKNHHYQTQLTEMKIVGDADVKELEKELEKLHEAHMEDLFENIEMSAKFQEHLDEAIEALPECEEKGQKLDGAEEFTALPMDYFLAIFKAHQFIIMYENKMASDNEKSARRAVMTSGDMKSYDLLVASQIANMQMRVECINKRFFEQADCPSEQFDQTWEKLADEETDDAIVEASEKMTKLMPAIKNLYKDEAIKYTVMMEEKRMRLMDKVGDEEPDYDMMQAGQIQAFDELWCEFKIEEVQIEDAAERYDWETDVKYNAAMMSMEKKYNKSKKK